MQVSSIIDMVYQRMDENQATDRRTGEHPDLQESAHTLIAMEEEITNRREDCTHAFSQADNLCIKCGGHAKEYGDTKKPRLLQ